MLLLEVTVLIVKLSMAGLRRCGVILGEETTRCELDVVDAIRELGLGGMLAEAAGDHHCKYKDNEQKNNNTSVLQNLLGNEKGEKQAVTMSRKNGES